jgi:tRNA-dependent cyclodipeptide synthase
MTDTFKVRFNSDLLHSSQAVLWVSVGGGRDFDGDRFLTVAKWAKETFDHVWIDLADTDKAINYQAFDGMSADKAYHTAKAAGDLWLVANSEAVDLIGGENVIRFDHWTASPDHAPFRETLTDIYKTDPLFKATVDADAWGYVQKKSTDQNIDQQRSCVSYILNEMAACCVRANELRATCVYPSKQKEAFRLVREQIIKGAPKELGLEPYLPIKVEHRKRADKMFAAS